MQKKVNNIKLSINGEKLKENFNINKGPLISVILENLYKARLDGLPENSENEFVTKYLNERNPIDVK